MMQMQVVSTCTHSLFLCAREPVCAISLSVHDLEMLLVNKRATSLPGDVESDIN